MKKRTQPKSKAYRSKDFIDKNDPLVKSFLEDISAYSVLPNNELIPLIIKAQAGDEDARKKVEQANCRLLVRIAMSFQYSTISLNDLVQEGYKGLHEAIYKYDPSKGVPFAHFSSWWIKMRIMKYMWWYTTTIRLPETQRLAINKLVKISSKFISEHDRVPTYEELIELSKLSSQKVKNYIDLFNCGNVKNAISLEAAEKEVSSITEDLPGPEEVTDKHLMIEAVTRCLDTLSFKHQEFLKDYYGIDRPVVPVGVMAKRSGTTTENIRQKRARLIKYLKANCFAELAPYAELDGKQN